MELRFALGLLSLSVVAAHAQSTMEEAPVPPINTASKQAVIDAYRQYYLPGDAAVALEWTGSLSPVNPGTTAQAVRIAMLQRLNWYRRMAGNIPNIVFDPQLNTKCQAGALMISAANAFTPYPPNQIPVSWPAYTPEGAEGAQKSVLGLTEVGPVMVAGYMTDAALPGAGHRSQLLSPRLLVSGVGNIPPNAGGGAGGNTIWTSATADSIDATIAWPPAGYVPILGPVGSFTGWPRYWTFGVSRADSSSVTTGAQANVRVAKNGVEIFSGTRANWDMGSDQPAHGDVYDVTVSNYYVDGAPQTFTYQVKPIDPDAPKLSNVSTRLRVETGDSVGIAGFVVAGDQPRRVIIRGIGPSLVNFGISGALSNPMLTVRNAGGVIVARNDDWQAPLPATQVVGVRELSVADSGFAPSNPLEAAVALELPPGAYTAVLEGVGGAMGVALVEVYDLDPGNADSQAVNVSTRGRVQLGDAAMIGGFVVRGSKAINVVVRALGPSLTALGVQGALVDPVLEVRDAAGALVAAADNTSAADAGALGQLLPSDSREAAVRLSLAPGSYTAIVGGKGGTTGVALVEAYEVK